MDDQNKNLILATGLSFLVILVWFVLFPPAEQDPNSAVTSETVASDVATDQDVASPTATTDPAASAAPADAVADALADAPRIAIETPRISGSLSLRGGRIDDLILLDYHEDLDDRSPAVRLLGPRRSDNPYLAVHGWLAVSGATAEDVPSPNTEWAVESGEVLTPETPVTLVWDNGKGLIFRKTISVDENFIFTVDQSVENTTGETVILKPYGFIAQYQDPDTVGFFVLHEGVVRMTDGTYDEVNYEDMATLSTEDSQLPVAENGWIAFTDQYWMTALVPEPGTPFLSVTSAGEGDYKITTIFEEMSVPANSTMSSSSRVYAGAQEWETIRAYQSALGVERFIDVIDWGWFFFLTKPIFAVLHWLHGHIGNMGWSIIGLTLIIKALVFPLAYKSNVSMAKMRELQPEMAKLKERAGDDREALQKGTMELYKKNKVNPASGCLPIILQIPIFFSLYKVIFVTIELRHTPWIGWIKDLSAPDPSSIFNLFGLLPYEVGSLGFFDTFSLGILPILLGISMFLQQKLNPAPADATQKMVFAWMPWIFMFMLGSFASGLVLYWIANNTITFTQQYIIMRMQGVKPDLVGNILGRAGETESESKK